MAKLRIRFTDEDAERLGVTELEYDPARPRFPEIRELKNQAGMNLVQFGELCADVQWDDYVRGVVAWLALIRHGITVPFEDFDVDVRGLVIDRDEAAEDPNSSAPDGANES